MTATLQGIHPELATDLDPVTIRQQIEADQQAAELTAKAIIHMGQLDNRIDYLQRKTKRLPIGNGKHKAHAEIKRLTEQRQHIADAIR